MTTFQKDSFTITIPTGGDPVEDWMDLISEIGSIFSMLTPETMNRCDGLYNLAVLLQALVPDYDTAQRMTKGAAAATSTENAHPAAGCAVRRFAAPRRGERPFARTFADYGGAGVDDRRREETAHGQQQTGRLSAGITIRS